MSSAQPSPKPSLPPGLVKDESLSNETKYPPKPTLSPRDSGESFGGVEQMDPKEAYVKQMVGQGYQESVARQYAERLVKDKSLSLTRSHQIEIKNYKVK